MVSRTKKPSKAPSKAKAAAPQKASAKAAPKDRDSLIKLRAHVNDIEKRLKRANTLTRSSVKALKSSFENLDAKSNIGASSSDLAGNIEMLSERLTGLIDQTRKDVAHDLQVVVTDPRLETLSAALTKANRRLSKAEGQQAEAIGAINTQIAALATAVDERMARETRERESVQEALSQRLIDVETNSTDAIKKIGEKVVLVSESLSDKVSGLTKEAAEEAFNQQKGYEEHKAQIAQRVEAIEDDQRNTVPSIERRLVTLASRLDALEAVEPQSYETPANAPPPFEAAPQYEAPTPEQEQPYGQLDAFSPSEPVQVQAIAPPQNTYEAQAQPVTEPIIPEQYGLQEYAPQEFVAPYAAAQGGGVATTYENPYAARLAGQEYVEPQAPSHAPFNPQTGAFEPAGIASTPYDQAPPPPPMPGGMPLDLPLADVPDETMDTARPGASPKAKKKRTMRRKIKSVKAIGNTGISSPVKIAALMVGVAVIGLFAAKAVLPKIIGSDEPAPSARSAAPSGKVTVPDFAAVETIPEAQSLQTIAAVGDYSEEMQAPDLGTDTAQKLTLEAAASKGDPIAQFQLGLSHLEAGRDADAVRLIRLAANQGQAATQYRLGKLYEFGIGVTANPATAMDLMEKAASNGNRIAMHDLGHYHATGTGGAAPNITQAVAWFQKAAERGVLDSQFNLGVLFQGGAGIEKSPIDSYVWYAVAGAQGDKVALQRRDLLARDLSPGQLAQAKSRVKAFTPKRVDDVANGVFRNLPWAQPAKARASVNQAVKNAQQMLSTLGYDVGTPDGAMGPKTRNAVISFERANGLPETGRVDVSLIERLSLAAGV